MSEDETPKFDAARMPEKIDLEVENGKAAWKVLYHLLAAAWWYARRDIANEKMRKHTQFFHHETEVTQFKREMNDE